MLEPAKKAGANLRIFDFGPYMVKIKCTGWFLAAVLVIAPSLAPAQHKLTKIKVNETVTVQVPKEWTVMDERDIAQRYPSVRAPLAAYTNYERVADFMVNISATRWPDDNVELAKEFFKAGLVNMFDKVEMIDEGVREMSGKKFIFFEFESRMNGNRSQEELREPILRYTYIQYLIQPGQALVFSFSCPRRIRDEWQPTARSMMKGIKVK
jgi:hypothetical protein